MTRGMAIIGNRLPGKDAEWLEMESFSRRITALDARWIAEWDDSLEPDDPRPPIESELLVAFKRRDDLFSGQAADIAERLMIERRIRQLGGDPYLFRSC